jgi:hypothetical protein
MTQSIRSDYGLNDECEVWGSHSGVAEDFWLLEHYAVSTGIYLRVTIIQYT